MQAREGNWKAAERAKMFLTHQTYKGLVMTVRSFKEASAYLLDHGVMFVLSNQFCQDPLEQQLDDSGASTPGAKTPTFTDLATRRTKSANRGHLL